MVFYFINSLQGQFFKNILLRFEVHYNCTYNTQVKTLYTKHTVVWAIWDFLKLTVHSKWIWIIQPDLSHSPNIYIYIYLTNFIQIFNVVQDRSNLLTRKIDMNCYVTVLDHIGFYLALFCSCFLSFGYSIVSLLFMTRSEETSNSFMGWESLR